MRTARRVTSRAPIADVHTFDEDPDAPGTCRCHLIQANAVHDPARVAAAEAELADAQTEMRRRLGEND